MRTLADLYGGDRTLMAYTGNAYMPDQGLVSSLVDTARPELSPYHPYAYALAPAIPVARQFNEETNTVEAFYPKAVTINTEWTLQIRPMFQNIVAGAYAGDVLGVDDHQNRTWVYHRSRLSMEARRNVEALYQSLHQHYPHHIVFHAPDMSYAGVGNMSMEEAQHDFWVGLHHGEGLYLYNFAYRNESPAVWNAYARALRLIKSEMKPSLDPALRWTPKQSSNGPVQRAPADDYLPVGDMPYLALPDGPDEYRTLRVTMMGEKEYYYAIVTNSWDQPLDFAFTVPQCVGAIDVVYGASDDLVVDDKVITDSFFGINARVYRIQTEPCWFSQGGGGKTKHL